MTKIKNEELIAKAITAADTLATNGKLNTAQSNKFIDYVIDETMLKNNARVIRFRNESLDIDKIGIGRRVTVAKTESRDPGIRRGASTSKVSLTPKEVMVPFSISDNFKELNIEGNSVEDRLVRMFATHLGNDLEELYITGNTLGPARFENDLIDGGSTTQYIKDYLLSLQNGWQLLADSGHVVDADGVNIGFSIFSAALRAMPTKYRRNKKNLRWFTSPDLAQFFYEKMTTRATKAGDDAASGGTLSPFGIKMVEVPLWDLNSLVVEHVVLSGTTSVTLKYKNITNVSVTPSTLANAPTTAYVSATDYTLDATAGTIVRIGTGSITDGETVKVTYSSSPQLILTHMNNYIVGIGRDVRIEKDRDIYASEDQYAITAKVSCQIEETDAVVKVKNIGEGV